MRLATAVVCAGVLWVPAALAATYIVRPDGTGDFPTIQAGINAAADGDVIELADGTFTGAGNRDIDYLGKAITVRSQGGNAEACVIDSEGSISAYHRGFYFHTGEGTGSTLSGVTIMGGYFDDGGGVRCLAASPAIVGCVVRDSRAENSGGGLACGNGAAPRVEGCTFATNRAGSLGGGACCWGESALHRRASPTFLACSFVENYCTADGGALAFAHGANATITDCTFLRNGCGLWSGGAGLACSGASPVLTGCAFIENVSGANGGGATFSYSYAVLTRCAFLRNSCAGSGGALAEAGSSLGISGCTFAGNTAGADGGAISTWSTESHVEGSTLFGNSAVSGSGVMLRPNAQLTVTRTIIAFGTDASAVACDAGASVTMSCCDIYGNVGDWVDCIEDQANASGNISRNPLFCDSAGGEFTLHANSPCAPDSNLECGLIGAWPVGCGGTPVEQTTWGGLKSLFR
jgi:hypothetical protein